LRVNPAPRTAQEAPQEKITETFALYPPNLACPPITFEAYNPVSSDHQFPIAQELDCQGSDSSISAADFFGKGKKGVK